MGGTGVKYYKKLGDGFGGKRSENGIYNFVSTWGTLLAVEKSVNLASTSLSGGLMWVLWMTDSRLRMGVVGVESSFIICMVTSCQKFVK